MPWMMTTTVVTHTMAAMVTTYLFLFQMAILEASMSASFGKRRPWLERMGRDIHAKNNQERGGRKSQVASDLKKRLKVQLLPLKWKHIRDLPTVWSVIMTLG